MDTTTPHAPVSAAEAAEATYQPVPAPSAALSPLVVAASAVSFTTAVLLLAIAIPLLS